eukprot:1609259-Pyramimonas_sp.AAC.1
MSLPPGLKLPAKYPHSPRAKLPAKYPPPWPKTASEEIIPVRPYLRVGASRKATLVGAANAVRLLLLIAVVVAVA